MNNKSVPSLSLRKLILSALVAAPVATLPVPLWALPVTDASNLTSSAGSATQIIPSVNTLNITTPDRTVLSWVNFGSAGNTIAAGETVNYNLPSASAAVLNRVTGANTTTIDGSLISNGKIFVLNPNGIIVGATGAITAQGVGLSTVNESDFTFTATGALSYAGTATGDVTSAGTITVGTGNNVTMVGQNVYVAGTVDAGTLTAIGGTVTLGGKAAVAGSGNGLAVGNAANKYGNVSVTTNGSVADLTGNAANVVINGGMLTVNTTSTTNVAGNVVQGGAGSLVIGNGTDAGSLVVTANGSTTNGTVTLPSVSANGGKQLNVTLTSGTADITDTTGDLNLNASTINSTATPALTLETGNGSILSGGTTTINGDGATISLTVAGNKKKMNYTGAGDLKFGVLGTAADATTTVALKSTTGAVTLPSPANAAASLAVTAATDITQAANTGLIVTGDTTLDAGNSTVLTSGTNDFTNIILKNAPSGASITDVNSVVVKGGTAATGNVTITTLNGGITLGSAATDVITVAGDLTLNTAQSVATLAVVTPGSGYAVPPVVTITGTGTGATGTATLGVSTASVTVAGGGAGYVVGDVVTLTGTGTAANATVATVDGTGAITGLTVTSPGSYTVLPTTVTGGTGAGATITSTGQVASLTVTAAGTGFTAVPTVTLTGNATASAALSAAGAISQANNALTVTGKVNVATGGTVTLAGATGNGVGLVNQFGQINGTAGAMKIYEATTLNLGNITAPSLNAYSATSIVNSGQLIIGAGGLIVGAGTAAAPGDIALDFAGSAVGAGNQITGTIFVNSDLGVLNTGQVGNYLAKSLTIVNENATVLAIPANIYGSGMTGDISITETSTNGIQNVDNTLDNAIVTTGNLLLNVKTGAINLSNTNNQFNSASVTSSGNVLVKAANAYTANATLTETAAPAKTAEFDSGDALTIGSYKSNYTGLTTFGSGNKKAITDAVDGIAIYGPVKFNSNGAITINNSGHSFGGVQVVTANNGTATIVESATMKLQSVAINGTGTFSATSTNGSILHDGTGNIVVGAVDKPQAATFKADQGFVVLGSFNNVDYSAKMKLFGPVSITASGNTTIAQRQSLTLGNVTVTTGTFTADVSGGVDTSIAQATGSKINVYGVTTFAAEGDGNITVANTGNRFGALTLATDDGDIAVTEQTTMNLQDVSTTGSFAASSETGDIIDSGSSAIATATAAGKTTSFTATKGNITLGLSSDYTTVAFTAAGNVSVLDTAGSLALGASTVGGTFNVTNSAGNITQSGALTITGDTTFTATAPTSYIKLDNSANQFGALKFFSGNNVTPTTIYEATTMNLRAGTVSTGQVILSTGGDFITSGSGSSSFLSTTGAVGSGLSISAPSGTIKPGVGALLVVNGMTVFSNVMKDLSGLSLSGNLYSKAPIDLGTGTYIPPSTP